MEAALMDTGKPLVIAPRAGQVDVAPLNGVAGIAWKDTRECAGAGHTRLREAVFGGFTRAVMEAAPLPVLMVH